MPGFLIALITVVHVAVCIALMAAILLQSGKGGGLAGTFGAGSSQTLFGGRGAATFLGRATTVLSVTFFLTSLTLGLNASRSSGTRQSLIQEEARRRGGQPQTAVPGGDATTAPGPAATQPPAAMPQPSGPVATPAQPRPAPTGGTTRRAPATRTQGSSAPTSEGTGAPSQPETPPATNAAPSAGTATQTPAETPQAPEGGGE